MFKNILIIIYFLQSPIHRVLSLVFFNIYFPQFGLTDAIKLNNYDGHFGFTPSDDRQLNQFLFEKLNNKL